MISNEEKDRILAWEKLAAEIVTTRQPPKLARWREVLESPAVVALVTVIVGGLFSTLIAAQIQERAGEREFQNEIVKMYASRTLEVRLRESRAGIEKAIELVGKTLDAAQARIDIDGPEFAASFEQQAQIRQSFNQAYSEWNAGKHTALAVASMHYGEEAGNRWEKLSAAVDTYQGCASHHVPVEHGDLKCAAERKPADEALRSFILVVRSADQKSWLDPEEIDRLRASIEATRARR